ncbi:hypothetical protein Krac_0525 [Ktedonobacter racemifer DSM 44963]|uniref:Transposase n=1 Tax=Ktedonobacter racemifer DSM 44963 TaxID=485913 RepID=D6U7X9_KTERA|nr:hypothetical protein Krac_0525 [Ktedonobacter racemifer DSM 44963]
MGATRRMIPIAPAESGCVAKRKLIWQSGPKRRPKRTSHGRTTSLQMAPLRNIDHSVVRALVFKVRFQLPRSGRDDARAGLLVDHSTIYRWVQRYAPELEKRCRPHLKTTNDSWWVDETYVKVRLFGACDDSISRMARLKADDLEDDWPTWRRKTKGKVACL